MVVLKSVTCHTISVVHDVYYTSNPVQLSNDFLFKPFRIENSLFQTGSCSRIVRCVRVLFFLQISGHFLHSLPFFHESILSILNFHEILFIIYFILLYCFWAHINNISNSYCFLLFNWNLEQNKTNGV